MAAIEIRGLTKRYGNLTAVDDLNLRVEQGELFALLGVNGAGKSTTVKMLSCVTQPTRGEAFIGGFSVTKQSTQVKDMIGVSPQETAVARKLTVRENLAFMCGVHGLTKAQTDQRINWVVEQMGLEAILHKRAGKLSGGWQRRVSIAMALISQPSVLFLDEPTLGLDVIARSQLWETIRAMKGKVTMVLTTHYMEEAQALSDRIGIMKDGKLLVVGTAGELMEKTGTDTFEKAFIAIAKEETL